MRITLNILGDDYTGEVRRDAYRANGAAALIFGDPEDGQQIAVLSVCLVDGGFLPDVNHTFLKTWSENAGLLEQLEEKGIVKSTGITVPTGHVRATMVEILAPELRREDEEGGEEWGDTYNSREDGRSDGQGESYSERNA